jgi:hypothetical protein
MIVNIKVKTAIISESYYISIHNCIDKINKLYERENWVKKIRRSKKKLTKRIKRTICHSLNWDIHLFYSYTHLHKMNEDKKPK